MRDCGGRDGGRPRARCTLTGDRRSAGRNTHRDLVPTSCGRSAGARISSAPSTSGSDCTRRWSSAAGRPGPLGDRGDARRGQGDQPPRALSEDHHAGGDRHRLRLGLSPLSNRGCAIRRRSLPGHRGGDCLPGPKRWTNRWAPTSLIAITRPAATSTTSSTPEIRYFLSRPVDDAGA